jgi:hypothetical protein
MKTLRLDNSSAGKTLRYIIETTSALIYQTEVQDFVLGIVDDPQVLNWHL